MARFFSAIFAVLLSVTTFSSAKAQTSGNPPPAYPTEVVPNLPIGFEVAAVAPDGSKFASGTYDGAIQLWDRPSGRLIRKFERHSKKVTSVMFVAGGSQILSASEDMTVKLWDAASGQLLKTTTLNSPAEYWWDLQLSPDGTRAVSAQSLKGSDPTGVVKLWDLASGKVIRSFRASTAKLAFTKDGKRLVTGGGSSDFKPGRQLLLWDVESGKLLQTFNGHPPFATIYQVAVSPDGSRILSHSMGSDNDIKLWDAATGQAILTFSKTRRAEALAFSPDGKTFLIYYADEDYQHSTVNLYETASGKFIKSFGRDRYGKVALFIPGADHLLMAANRLEEVDIGDGRVEQTFGAKLNYINEPVFSADGAQFLSGGDAIRQWDFRTGKMLSQFPAPDKGTYSGVFSPANHLVLWSLPDQKTKKLQDWQTGRIIATLIAPTAKVFGTAAAISPDGKRVATVSYDNQLRIWDSETARVIRSISHPENIDAVAYTPDGLNILSGDGYGTIRAFDAASGRPIWTYKNGSDVQIVWSMKFSTDGLMLLAAIGEHGAKILDAKTGRLIRGFDGHKPGYITSGAEFSADGSHILTSSHDETVKYWDVATGKMLRSFDTGSVSQPTFTMDGHHALLANHLYNLDTGDREVSIYSVNDSDWIAITSEGYFAGSENSAATLSIVRGFDIWTIDQLYQSLSRSDLVREKLAGDPRGLVREAASRLDLTKVLAAGNAPDVRLSLPGRSLGSGSVDVSSVATEAEITDRGGGIGRVEWRVNGVTAGIDTRVTSSAGQPARLSRNLLLDPGENMIEVVAYNNANLLASMPARLNVASRTGTPPVSVPQPPGQAPVANQAPPPAPAPVAQAKPRLFMLVAGVNEYADQRIKLSYAVSDAKEVARGFKEASGSLYESADVKLLIDSDVNRDKLDEAFAEMAGKAQPSEVFVALSGRTRQNRRWPLLFRAAELQGRW